MAHTHRPTEKALSQHCRLGPFPLAIRGFFPRCACNACDRAACCHAAAMLPVVLSPTPAFCHAALHAWRLP
eukprot:64692-Chlamydomonas_euryale.AAC.1